MRKPSVVASTDARAARARATDGRVAEALDLFQVAVEAYATLHGVSNAEARRVLAREKHRLRKRSVAGELDGA